MKKVFIVCAFTLFLGLISNSVLAIQYCKDLLEPCNPGGWSLSFKTFDEGYYIGPGSAYEIDIWLNDVPIPLLTAGFWVVCDSTQIDIEGALIYDGSDLPGPWNPSVSTKVAVPDGPGTYFVAVGGWFDPNIPIMPDDDGDIIIAKIQLLCLGSGVSDIMISTIPGFDTVVGENLTVFDPFNNTISMTQVA